jgi:probable 2-oxoglutarate dehydrogenase E1 component DHKTD1
MLNPPVLQVSTSKMSEFEVGSKFLPVITDGSPASPDLKRILLVSGKVNYDLQKEVDSAGLNSHIKIIRIEEICPFPFTVLGNAFKSVLSAATDSASVEVFWVQEEARNQGPYTYIAPRVSSMLDAIGWRAGPLRYIGRREMEVPAVGAASLYARDKQTFLQNATRL